MIDTIELFPAPTRSVAVVEGVAGGSIAVRHQAPGLVRLSIVAADGKVSHLIVAVADLDSACAQVAP